MTGPQTRIPSAEALIRQRLFLCPPVYLAGGVLALRGAVLGTVCNFTSPATLFPGGVLLEDNTMPELTAERARELLDYDPLTGDMTWRSSKGGRVKGAKTGRSAQHGYLHVSVDRKIHPAHRVAWLIAYGCWPANQIDHINGVRTDNRLTNLRDVPSSHNAENQRRAKANNKTGFLGVYRHARDKKYTAEIQAMGKRISIGRYTTPEEAHQAYLTAKRQLHAGCTI